MACHCVSRYCDFTSQFISYNCGFITNYCEFHIVFFITLSLIIIILFLTVDFLINSPTLLLIIASDPLILTLYLVITTLFFMWIYSTQLQLFLIIVTYISSLTFFLKTWLYYSLFRLYFLELCVITCFCYLITHNCNFLTIVALYSWLTLFLAVMTNNNIAHNCIYFNPLWFCIIMSLFLIIL